MDVPSGLTIVSNNGNNSSKKDESVEVQEFMHEVDENKEIQEEKLTKMLSGLNILYNMGTDMGTEIKVQKVMLNELETKIDKTQEHLNREKNKLQELLDNSGGFAKWCGGIICVIILFVLIALLLNQTKII